MKGAFLVGRDAGMFETAKKVLLSLGGQISDDNSVIQIRDETGGFFTVYRVPSGSEGEFRDGPLCAAPGLEVPDLSAVSGLAIECRNEFQFVTFIKAIARASSVDTWVIDGDGVVWSAGDVDASRVRL